ncbi:hypothetical protein N7536_004380 [Penicillium majusculum]|nr:hypothetical protein N7536_004380 [Penicillium majusculum]
MAKNIEIAQGQKLARRARLTQQNDKVEQRRIEKAQRNQQQRDQAEEKRVEKAQRNQQEKFIVLMASSSTCEAVICELDR